MNRIIKNTSWIVICKIVQSILNLVVSMLTARYLGTSNFGLINYAASVVAFVIPLMQLGLRSTLVYEFINKPNEEGKTLGTALLMNVVSALLCMAAIAAFVTVANHDEKKTIIVCILYSINLIFQALEMTQYWFQKNLLSKYTSLISLIAYVVVSVYKIYLLVTHKNIYWFAIAQAIDYCLIAVLLLCAYKKCGGQKLSISFKRGKEMLAKSKYYIVSSMMVAIFASIGSIFLKFLIDEQAVGYYTVAMTCAGMTGFIFAAIIDSARPIILESKSKDTLSYEKKIIQLYSVIIAITLIQSIFITVFSGFIVKLLYGSQYINAIIPLKIYTWQTVFSQIGTIRNIWILAEGKQRYLWVINLVGAILSIVLNFALIPVAGPSGAALSAVVTQLFTNVILGFIFKPIRENNALLLKSFDGKVLFDMIKTYIGRT